MAIKPHHKGNTMDSTIQRIREANQNRTKQAQETKLTTELVQSNSFNQKVIFDAFQAMTDALNGEKTKAEAISQIFKALEDNDERFKDSQTDMQMLKSGLKTLEQQLQEIPTDDLKKIPKFLEQRESVKVSNLDEVKDLLESLVDAVKNQELNVEAPVVNVEKPVVNVPAPVVNVDAPDLSPIKTELKEVTKAVKANKNPDVVKTEQTNTLIQEKFDEFKIKYDEFDEDSEKIEAITYYYKGKKVARINYTYDESGNLLGGKKA